MTGDDYDASFIAEALPAFVTEAREHLQMLEELLLQLEDDSENRELLDALFRSAHTIKGSAGIFGIDAIVAFTHHVETLLEQVRRGAQRFDAPMGTLLLQSADHIRLLLGAISGGGALDAAATAEGDRLVDGLRALYSGSPAGGTAPPGATRSGESDAAPAGAAAAAAAATAAPPASVEWRIQVRFGGDTFRNGMDPLAILHYLGGLGTLRDVRCDVSAVPVIEELDPESCCLSLSLAVVSDRGRDAIESAFSFVREDCDLTIEGDEPPALVTAAAADDATGAAIDEGGDEDASVAIAPTTGGASARAGSAAARPAVEEARFIRVRADRLDTLIDLLGELVIASAGASLLARHSRQSALVESSLQVAGLVEEIRNGTLQLRMVPIGDTFARFRRVVRDTAAELGKDIALTLVGTETELDKSVVERIADPLMHLVRNALDHGLETPEQRIAAGKPAQGRLTLSACHESGSILIRIDDDGRGIDRERVLRRARERGLVAPDAEPSDAEVIDLIFQPGFSTAEKVTNLSGRGVGMDVVRRNIEALRGSVTVSSVAGQGSSIEIRLPLTLAIIDGFLVGVGPSRFIFPLDGVIEVLEAGIAEAATDGAGRRVIELRGQLLPVVDLRRLYELDSNPPPRSSVVVVRSGNHRIGVMVDQLLGQHQTVIKPLARIFQGLRGISGSTILGTGEVALIFDVAALGEVASDTGVRPRISKESA
jgi:two-component system, chemotaxis family, sensor kinase CheA